VRIFKNYTDIFLKCNNRISGDLNYRIMEDSAYYGSKLSIAFSNYYYQKRRTSVLLRTYQKKGIISFLEAYISIVYINIRSILKLLKDSLSVSRFELYHITRFNYSHSHLTFDGGVERLTPVNNSISYEAIEIDSYIRKVKISERTNVLLGCLKRRVYSFSLILQYNTLYKEFDRIDFGSKSIFVEEARNITQLCFLEYAKMKKLNITIGYRGIPPISRYYFGFKVVTTNKVAFNRLNKYNGSVYQTRVPYLLDFTKLRTNRPKSGIIGYLTEIGNSGITYHEKEILDNTVIEFSKENKVRTIVSLHPQEIKLKSEYYQNKFHNDNIEFRKDKLIESYLNSIDILVGFTSTAIFQAFLAGVPTIILDYFNDRPMCDLVKNSNGLIKYATDSTSLKQHYKYFKELDIETIQDIHSIALNNIEVEIPKSLLK
jgi:hypothetical protein